MRGPALPRVALPALLTLLAACEQRTPPPAPDTAAPDTAAPDTAPDATNPAPNPAPGTGIVSTGGGYYVEFRTDPDPVPLNELFSIEVSVRDADARDESLEGIELMVDGRMPAHRHGMTREPRIERRPDGTFVVTGMLFHMLGDWELHFDITRDGTTERAQADVVLE